MTLTRSPRARVARARAATLLVLGAALVACDQGGTPSEEPVSRGPLRPTSFAGEVCMPRFPNTYTHGQEIFENTASDSVTVTAVGLRSALDVTDGGSYIRPMTAADELVGVRTGWNPDGVDLETADGYEIEPGETVNVVVRLDPVDGAPTGSIAGLTIDYSVGDRAYRVDSRVRVRLKKKC